MTVMMFSLDLYFAETEGNGGTERMPRELRFGKERLHERSMQITDKD